MDYIERYRRKRLSSHPDRAADAFIEKALNKIKVRKVTSGEVSIESFDSVLIFKDREGADTATFYTYTKDKLDVGTCILREGATKEEDIYFILTEEVNRVDASKTIRVFRAAQANVYLMIDGSEKPAYMTTAVKEISLQQTNSAIQVERKGANLIVPKGYNLRLYDILRLKNIATGDETDADWRIDGKDDITSPRVTYAWASQVLKQDDVQSEPEAEYMPGTKVTFATKDGYVKTSGEVVVLARSQTEVTLRLPNKVVDLTIELMHEDGTKFTKEIKVGR